MNLSPIVVFAYNRPTILKQTLEALSANEEAKDSLLYIFCDGPKATATQNDIELINAVKNVAREKQWCKEVVIIESEKNNGLSKAIISGVSTMMTKHDRIIVLEDDLVVSPYFLKYMNTGLDTYENNHDVISIVGYNYPLDFSSDDPQTYFLKNADCLGWATWKRGWALFEENAQVLLDKIVDMNAISEFNFDNQYPYSLMLKKVAEGTVNSWAIRWYASSFVHHKLSLFPAKSMVRHIGHVGSNVKADNSDIFGWEISMEPITFFDPVVKENVGNRRKLAMHFRKYNRRRLSISTIKYAYKRFILSRFK